MDVITLNAKYLTKRHLEINDTEAFFSQLTSFTVTKAPDCSQIDAHSG